MSKEIESLVRFKAQCLCSFKHFLCVFQLYCLLTALLSCIMTWKPSTSILQSQRLLHSTEELNKSAQTMQGNILIWTIYSLSFFMFAWFKNEKKNLFFFFAETLEKLGKKEEQCTSLTNESESLRSQLAGKWKLYVICWIIYQNNQWNNQWD